VTVLSISPLSPNTRTDEPPEEERLLPIEVDFELAHGECRIEPL
jgi:hypothetical protein